MTATHQTTALSETRLTTFAVFSHQKPARNELAVKQAGTRYIHALTHLFRKFILQMMQRWNQMSLGISELDSITVIWLLLQKTHILPAITMSRC